MPTRNLDTLFSGWERELRLLLETRPTHQEFWDYWREREEAVERLATPRDAEIINAAFDHLFAIAESSGYVRVPVLPPVVAEAGEAS